MDQEDNSVLPEFESPPLIEVVFGVVLKPLTKLLTQHVHRYWDGFRPDFPHASELPVLLPSSQSEPILAVCPPFPRIWLVSKTDQYVIQIQRDRFIFNWRKRSSHNDYPHYGAVRDLFGGHLEAFSRFVQENNLGEVVAEQCELTYVNHIPQEGDWPKVTSIGNLFPDFSWRNSPRDLPAACGIHWRTVFFLPRSSGLLHVNIVDAKRESDGKDLIQFELIARSGSQAFAQGSILPWFDSARGYIVKAFVDLTSESAQNNVWRKKG